LLMGFVFYLITSGCSVFGLLCSRVAQRLGDVSYGIYLLQGLVLTIVFSFGPARALALASPVLHWSMMLSCAVLLVVVATCTHTWIERTGIETGKRVGVSLRARVAQRNASGPALSPSHDRL
jgi:peptidoglycan/LPS O-acetylase OafA/YrhL